jgi:hypothetical protein
MEWNGFDIKGERLKVKGKRRKAKDQATNYKKLKLIGFDHICL